MPALDLYCGTQKTIRGQKSAWWKRRVAECQPCPEFLEARFWTTVAVGTTITDRPPHRSVHARLRIRLLPRMNGVEALVGIRMEKKGVRNPPVEQWVETVPSHLRALTATD